MFIRTWLVLEAEVRGADGNVKIIASLCALYHDASEEDVSKMVEKASNMIGDLFRKSSGFRTRSHAEQLGGIDTGHIYGPYSSLDALLWTRFHISVTIMSSESCEARISLYSPQARLGL